MPGFCTAVIKASVPTAQREAWYSRKVSEGVQVAIGHPKLVETGLDLLDFPTLIFYETGYSLHTLRQSSRRSWRIGQKRPVRVFFLCQERTMQTKCLRLMGKKLLVALTLEGKFAGEGLHDIEENDDMLAAMARELVEKDGVGETADAVWSQLKQVYDQLPRQTPEIVEAEDESAGADAGSDSSISAVPVPFPEQSDLLVPSAAEMIVPTLFGQAFPSLKRNLFTWN